MPCTTDDIATTTNTPTRDAHDRERRADLVGAERVERDADALERLGDGGRGCAWLTPARSASMGSSARRGSRGTRRRRCRRRRRAAWPTTSDQGATAAGSGVVHAMSFAPSDAEPDAERSRRRCSASPLSTRNWRRMSFRRAPSDLRMPISRVRSATATSMMFMITMPADDEADRRQRGAGDRHDLLLIFWNETSADAGRLDRRSCPACPGAGGACRAAPRARSPSPRPS